MKLEDKIKNNAEEIFTLNVEPAKGHRERFAQRLSESNVEKIQEIPRKRKQLNLALWSSVAAAAILVGFVFLLHPKTEGDGDITADNVKNYYAMQLEEKADETVELLKNVDAAHRAQLIENIDNIKNEPVPNDQMTDDDRQILVANVYTARLEALKQIQDMISQNN